MYTVVIIMANFQYKHFNFNFLLNVSWRGLSSKGYKIINDSSINILVIFTMSNNTILAYHRGRNQKHIHHLLSLLYSQPIPKFSYFSLLYRRFLIY